MYKFILALYLAILIILIKKVRFGWLQYWRNEKVKLQFPNIDCTFMDNTRAPRAHHPLVVGPSIGLFMPRR